MKKWHVLSLFVLSMLILSAGTLQATAYAAAGKWSRLLTGAYRIDRNGWIFVHLEGDPFQIGFPHGYLLADNINISWSAAIHVYWSEEEFGDWWYAARDIARLYIWRKVPAEYRVEMEGIVAGLRRRNTETGIYGILWRLTLGLI